MTAHQAKKGDTAADGSIVEQALVEDGEQGVQDGAVGLEHLVDEGHRRIWQVAFNLPHVLILLQGPHGQWPKQLLQMPFKVSIKWHFDQVEAAKDSQYLETSTPDVPWRQIWRELRGLGAGAQGMWE